MSFPGSTFTALRSNLIPAFVAGALAIGVAGCQSVLPATPDRIAIDAQPNGIAIGANDNAIFVTDDRSNAIMVSRDHSAFTRYAGVPVVPGQPNSLGEVIAIPSGELLVARFGFGETGALFISRSSGEAQALAGLATERRRLGLASLGPGRVLSSWFVRQKNAPLKGGVSLVSYDPATHAATERDLIASLAKPVGVAVHGDAVLVADQDRNTVLQYSLTALLAAQTPVTADSGTVFAQIDHPDLLAIDKAGTVYTKCGATGFCRIAPDGAVTPVANDFQNARGVAIDDASHALYVVDRATAASAKGSAIRILPIVDNPAASR
jgi:DNA-binding beta-propeller fold protein YncE